MAARKSSPNGTPAAACSEKIMVRMPTAADSHPAAITSRACPGSRHPKTSTPVAPAAASSARPQYSSHRPATAAGAGGEPIDSGPPFAAPVPAEPEEGWIPIRKAKEPPVTCPSTFDTVRQFTVYTPSVRVGSVARSSCASPGTAAGVPTPGTIWPEESSRESVDRPGSGGSVK